MKQLLLALLLIAQPAFAGDDDRKKHRKYDREYHREYDHRKYDHREYDRRYHCHYHRGREYCHTHPKKEYCVWVQYKNVGFWSCEK